MSGYRKIAISLLFVLISALTQAQVYDLRCDGMRTPLGIESKVPHFSWKNTLTHNGQEQTAYEIEVASDSIALERGNADLWRSGRVESDEQLMIEYQGRPLSTRQLCFWRVRTWNEKGEVTNWSSTERFAIGALDGLAADFIGCQQGDSLAQTPMFRQYFKTSAKNPVFVYINSLGYHELYINGKLVGDKVLQPAVSQLDKRSLIVTYDITSYLRKGKNEILLWVGQGWGRIYNTNAVVQAEVCELVDGQWIKIAQTDATWEVSGSGYSYTGSWQPLQFGGECLDARIKPDWHPANLITVLDLQSSPQQFEGNRIIDTLQVKSIIKQDDGSLVLDFGRAITGWLNVAFESLPKGQEVLIEYSDHIPTGAAFTPQGESDIYISDGRKSPSFCNKFHYHAFRYVRISGAEIKYAEALQISAIDPEQGANFSCSDTLLNAVHDLIKYTLSCLTYSGYMVDCPHLERMGYGGDGNSSTMTLQTMYDVLPTYHNWMTAWGDAMGEDGELAYVAPDFRTGGGPYWCGFIIKAPWRTYLNYGDWRLIEQYYEQMKQWLGYLQHYFSEGILQPWPDNERHTWCLGDWLAPDGINVHGESAIFVSNCFLSDCLRDMAKMAYVFGHESEMEEFMMQRRKLNESIHARFYHPDSQTYGSGTPVDLAYSLVANIPPDSETRNAVQERLLDDSYRKYNSHIAVGLVGVPIFTEWAIHERQADLIATILRQPDYPSYLNMIANGATTTWESWNGDRSHIHNCYNGIGTWFYQALAGIRPDEIGPGYRHFYIDPQIIEDVDQIEVTQPTPYGSIRIKINDNKMFVRIPVGTMATLFPNTLQEQTLTAGFYWDIPINK
ncbi:MAG: glycoside hydrolase family 78 protein [Bacteroidales bacterium]|nr:glycoside hydrolase family 78 protein [Bacteroidales bacterium]